MKITDCQVHEIGPHWDWLGEDVEVQNRLMGEITVAYLNATGVDRLVIFCGAAEGPAAWMAANLPDRVAYVPHVHADDPEVEGTVIAARARHAQGQLGLRALVNWPPHGPGAQRLQEGAWDAVFAACERHGVPLFAFLSGIVPLVEGIVRRFPRLTLIVDHIGIPQPPMEAVDTPPFAGLPDVLRLAAFPNVHLKLCGLPALSAGPYPFDDVKPHLRAIVDAFGADRLMWGSDTSRFVGNTSLKRLLMPRTNGDFPGKHSYAESQFFIRESDVLNAEEKAAILGGTLARVLDWPEAEPAD